MERLWHTAKYEEMYLKAYANAGSKEGTGSLLPVLQ